MEYIVDEEFAGLHRKLTSLELEQLEANCREDGAIHDPIMVWGQYILDGRHRLPIAEKYGLPYEVREVALASREEAKRWVVNNQLGKRNLSDQEMQRLRAEQAKLKGTKLVAEAHGVDVRTVQRDVELEAAVAAMPEDIRENVASGKIISTKKAIKAYGDLSQEQRNAVDAALRAHTSLTLQQALPKKTPGALTAADYEDINTNPHISTKNKRSLACETLGASSKAVAKLSKMKPEEQIVINELLNDASIDSLDEAIKQYEIGRAPLKASDKASKVVVKAKKLLGDLLRTFDEYKGHKPSELHAECISKAKELLKTFENWSKE